MLLGWNVVALGPETVFVCDVADRYGCTVGADIRIETLLDYHSFPVIICVQQCALLADCSTILV